MADDRMTQLSIITHDSHYVISMAPGVASILAREFGKDEHWQADQVKGFGQTAQGLFGRSLGALVADWYQSQGERGQL